MTTEWPRTALSALLRQVSRPEDVDPSREYTMLGTRWYAGGLFKKEVQSGQTIKAARVYRVECGDFIYNRLFAWKGSFAVANDEAQGCYVSNEFPCFEVDASRLDARYLMHYFTQVASWNKALGLSSGATPTSRNRLKEKQFLGMSIPLPPMDEQCRLVRWIEAIAERIEEARGLRGEAVEEVEALSSTAVSRLFRASGGTTVSVGDLVGEDGLRNGKSVKSSEGPDGIRCLTLSSMRRGLIDIRESKPVPIGIAEAAQYLVCRGDVFVIRGNGSKHLCGLAGMVKDVTDDVIYPDLFIRVQLPADRILPEYFVAIWNSSSTRSVIEDKARTTSGIWKVNQGHIAATAIPLPSLSEQRRMVAKISHLETAIAELTAQQSAADQAIKAMLPTVLDEAFRGGCRAGRGTRYSAERIARSR